MSEEMGMPEIELVEGERMDEPVDIPGQIKALEAEIDALELQYSESNVARIDALRRQKAELEARM